VRFLYGMILDWKVLPCKSGESAHVPKPADRQGLKQFTTPQHRQL
jgi:hypothetical protein